jgi:hypothetical protein
MRLRVDLTVGHPAADVWAAMSSPAGAACLSALDRTAGTFTLLVGSGTLVLEGTADVAADPRALTVTLHARAAEASGGGGARVTLMARVGDDGLFSTIDLEAEVVLSGDLGTRSRLIAEALYRIADEWAVCLEEHLGPGTPPRPVPAQPPVAEADRPRWLGRLVRRIRGG